MHNATEACICSFESSAGGFHPSGKGGSGGTLRHSGLRCDVDLCLRKVLAVDAVLLLASVGRRPRLRENPHSAVLAALWQPFGFQNHAQGLPSQASCGTRTWYEVIAARMRRCWQKPIKPSLEDRRLCQPSSLCLGSPRNIVQASAHSPVP